MNHRLCVPLPPVTKGYWWEGTEHVRCSCGGWIEWAEGGYVPGSRACRSCLQLYQVDDKRRMLVPQCLGENHVEDADAETDDDDLYKVPENLYPNWYQPAEEPPCLPSIP